MATKKSAAPAISLETIYQVWGWILFIWSLYRYFFRNPEWVDEFIMKPLVFVAPVLWFVWTIEKRKAESVGLHTKNIFTNIYIGLGFGVVFGLVALATNALKHGQLTINPISFIGDNGLLLALLLSLATAFSEEILNRGFLFQRILEKSKNLPFASFLSTIFFVVLHLPILATQLRLTGPTLVIFFLTDFILGLANTLLLYNTGSLVAPILVHLFWNMTVALYL